MMAIKTCVCEHEYQDRVHGPQRRVCTPAKVKGASGPDRVRWICTVCGRER